MTYRKSLIVGLVVGLAAAPAIVQAADSSPWQKPTLSPSNVPEIKLQPSAASAAATAADHSNWQPSEQSATADIRFKKPEVSANRQASFDATMTQSTQLPALGAPISPAKPAAKFEITDIALPAGSAGSRKSAPLSDLFTPMTQRPAAIEPPATQRAPILAPAPAPICQQQAAPQIEVVAPPQTPAVEPPPVEPTENIAAKKPEPVTVSLLDEKVVLASETQEANHASIAPNAALPEIRLTDEQLQLVAQILNDGRVVRAAQEEPLPAAPNADPFGAEANGNRNGRGPELHHDEMYYGECCPPQPSLFWVAGVEATFLNPDINSDGVSWAVEDVLESREEVHISDDIDSMYLSPRIWIGVQGCAWGANLRYWHLNASESQFDPSIGNAGTWDGFDCGQPNVGFFSMSRLEAYTIDLELTRRFCLHDCAMQGSIGIRHADIQYAESITGTAVASDVNLFGYAEANRFTRGTGVVLGLYGRKPLFPCSCVHWYYNVRWSALWGPTRTAVETGATVLATNANAGSVNGAYTCVDDNLFIGEVQLGLEWNYALQCVPANAFFRAGVEYQRWTGGMGYSESGSFAGVEVNNTFEQIGSTFASAAAPELDLVGITLGTGLTW